MDQPVGNRQTWERMTSIRLARASSLSADMLDRLRKYEASEALDKKKNQEFAEHLREMSKTKARGRIKAHTAVIDEAQWCMQRIETACTQLEAARSKLTHERYKEFADLQVCQRRLLLRERRPEPETFKDSVEQSLEQEQQVLVNARQQLLQKESEVKHRREELSIMRAGLSTDTGRRRLEVEHEMTNLRPGKMSSFHKLPAIKRERPQSVTDSPKSPSTSFCPTPRGITKAQEPPPEAKKDTRWLITTAMRQLHDVDNFCQECESLVKENREKTTALVQQTAARLEKRTDELSKLKSKMEDQVQTINFAIQKATRDLEKHTKRLNPAELLKVNTIEECKALLNQLTDTKSELVQDLQCKILALDIDNSCRRVTPQVACEQKGAHSPGAVAMVKRSHMQSKDYEVSCCSTRASSPEGRNASTAQSTNFS